MSKSNEAESYLSEPKERTFINSETAETKVEKALENITGEGFEGYFLLSFFNNEKRKEYVSMFAKMDCSEQDIIDGLYDFLTNNPDIRFKIGLKLLDSIKNKKEEKEQIDPEMLNLVKTVTF